MPTLAELINDTRAQLQGFVLDQEQFTTLTGNVAANDLTIPVEAESLGAGVIEVDDELILISSVNRASDTATAIARGWASSTATTHTAGAVVRVNPAFPRTQIKRYIQDTITSLYPAIWKVKQTSITITSAVLTYALPEDVTDILAIRLETVGPSKTWLPAYRWDFNPNANVTAFPTGKTLDLFDYIVPGRKANVVYMGRLDQLESDGEDLVTDAGAPASCRDLVIYGACARLLPALEASRLTSSSIEQSTRSADVVGGQAINASRQYYALFNQRLTEERDKLNRTNPVMSYMTY